MSSRKSLYSIGQLAEMCGASVKQLRYLEEKGLLIPELRDSGNSYRYYSQEQLKQLVLIKNLRDLGFPFEDVVKILQSGEEDFFCRALKKQMTAAAADVKKALQAYDRLIAYHTQMNQSLCLKHDLASGLQALPDIRLVDVPCCTAVFTRQRAAANSQELFIDRFFELQKMCQDKQVTVAAGMIAIFHDGWSKQFDGAAEDLEILFPIAGQLAARDIRVFGGFQGVGALHVGEYKDMKTVYLQIMDWAEEKGLALMEIAVEKYLLGPDMVSDPSQYITQIIIPLAGSKI